MRHYVRTFILTLLLGVFSSFGNHDAFAQQVLGGPTLIVKPDSQTVINPNAGTNLDLTRLGLGQSTYVEMRDAVGTPYTFRVKKLEDNRFAVAAKVEDLQDIQPNTTIRFVGKDGLLKAVNLSELSNQRCGVWCLVLHICCVHIHIGPPANTWEWSCSNCQPGQN